MIPSDSGQLDVPCRPHIQAADPNQKPNELDGFLKCPVQMGSESARRYAVLQCGDSWRARFASREIARYASGILGRAVPVVGEFRPSICNLVIGWPLQFDEISDRSMELMDGVDLGEEGFLIHSLELGEGGKHVLMAGGSDSGTLYGVYHYLEKVCNVGFFWSADHVPSLTELPIGGLDIVERPGFKERFMTMPGGYSFHEYWTWPEWKRELEYRVRKKLNLIALHLGMELVWNEILTKYGVPNRKLSKEDEYRDLLYKRIFEHARRLGLRTITPAFMGDVPAEFAAANPEVRFVEMRKWDMTVPKRLHIHPSDPMFKALGEEFLRAYARRYGTDHYYFVPPYPEAYAGSTPEETRRIKLDFAGAVQEYMGAADPDWRWLADSWTFFTQEFWPLEEIRSFCLATDPGRFCIYDTWGEERPLYKLNDYYYGREWTLGILHSFGGNTTLRGSLPGLIESISSLPRDPRADGCVGVYLVPEVIHHNDLYFDLAMELMWCPAGMDLDAYIEDYCVRRYGGSSAKGMHRALSLLAQGIYSDSDLTQPLFLRRLKGGYDTPNTEHYVPPLHLTYARMTGDAIALALGEADRQGSNPLYLRDLVDMTRRFYGDVFNQRVSRLYYAYDSGDRDGFRRQKEGITDCLSAVEEILWSWEPYQLEHLFKRLRGTDAFDPGRERSTRDMLSLWESENLHDYVRRDDLAELFTGYYRRRVEAYVDHLEERLGTRQPGIDEDALEEAYRRIGERWIEESCAKPSEVSGSDPVVAAKRAHSLLMPSLEELGPEASPDLVNPRFEDGLEGWKVAGSGIDLGVKTSKDGENVLAFSAKMEGEMKYLTVWQDIDAREIEIDLGWRLDSYGPSSRAGLRLELLDGSLRKRAQVTYQFGDGGDFWPDRTMPDDAGPDWRIGRDARLEWWTGFHNIKRRLGCDTGSWHRLRASPCADLKDVHGVGLDSLGASILRISLIASSRNEGDPIAGAFSGLRVHPPGKC